MSKTEQPTAQRLRRALREGEVPFSSMAVRTAALLAAVATLPSAAHAVRARFVDRLHAALLPGAPPNPALALVDIAALAGPMLVTAAVVAASIGLLQTRGATTLGSAARTRRQSRRMPFFEGRRAARAILGVAAAALIVTVTLRSLRRLAPDIARALPSASRALELPETLLWSLALPVFAVLVAAALVDWWLEHVYWFARLRMSPREIKDERREQEGDPSMRRARRRAHEELARGRQRSAEPDHKDPASG